MLSIRFRYATGISFMARLTTAQQLEAYRKQQVELAKKIKEVEAEDRKAAKEKLREKRELAGTLALAELDANPQGQFATLFLGLLNGGLTKDAHRALFPALASIPRPNGQDETPGPVAADAGGATGVGGG
jgi:hypothetical protein